MDITSASPPFGHRSPALRLAAYAVALLMTAAATIVAILVSSRWDNAAVVLLYLPPVLVAAVYAGLGPGLLAGIASTLAYNYYFTAPYHTFMIHSPADIVTVVTLLFVAVVSSQLAASVRTQARIAASHAARNATIAGFARRLLSCGSEDTIYATAARQIASLFDCLVVILAGSPTPLRVASLPADIALAPSDCAAAALTLETGRPSGRRERRLAESDWQFHPVLSGPTALAAIGLARDDGTAPVTEPQLALFGSLLDQMALALERARLETDARDAAAILMRDRLRSALLSSIGEEVKPRLNTIIDSARTLRREDRFDKSLASGIAEEATKLDHYIDNLVELDPGSDHQPIAVGDLSIDLHRRTVRKGEMEVRLTPKEFALLAELAKHAGRVLTHAYLLRAVWGPAQADHIDYLRVAIRALRQKLEADPAAPTLIVNVPSIGYSLSLPKRLERAATAQ